MEKEEFISEMLELGISYPITLLVSLWELGGKTEILFDFSSITSITDCWYDYSDAFDLFSEPLPIEVTGVTNLGVFNFVIEFNESEEITKVCIYSKNTSMKEAALLRDRIKESISNLNTEVCEYN